MTNLGVEAKGYAHFVKVVIRFLAIQAKNFK
jgi:hypothetical protein